MARTRNSYDDINFKILAHTNEQLIAIGGEIIAKFGLAEISGKYALIKLIREIASGYNTVSYHNFSHAFSLMHVLLHIYLDVLSLNKNG